MKVVVDIDEFKSLVDKEFKWDKEHKKECGWDDHDISMIAVGMLKATDKLIEMVYKTNEADHVAETNHVGYGDTIRFTVDLNELHRAGKKPIRACHMVKKDSSVLCLDENEFWKCPNSHGPYDIRLRENQKYCHECGQLIDWSK